MFLGGRKAARRAAGRQPRFGKDLRRAGALACAIVLLGFAAPAAFGVEVQDLVGEVSQARYAESQLAVQDMGLGWFDANFNQGYRARDGWSGPGDLGNQETRAYLGWQFSQMGLDVAVQGPYRNVIGELPGTQTPEEVYIVCGHYDHLGGAAGNERPGGDDNASGAAGVLEAARVLGQYQFGATIRFIGFNSEEDGLLGSKDYVASVVKSVGQPGHQDVAGVINLDMILRPGNDQHPTYPIDLDVCTNSNSACVAWANQFIGAARAYVPGLAIDSNAANTSFDGASDQKPFIDAGYPAFLAIENTANEIWGGSNGYYHGPNDAGDRLANDPNNASHITYDYAFAADVVRAVVATIAQEAGLVPDPVTHWSAGAGEWSDLGGWTTGRPRAGVRADISNGGAVAIRGPGAVCFSLTLGGEAGQSGEANMTGGSLSSRSVFVGYGGRGRFDQSGGTHAIDGNFYLGHTLGSSGAYGLWDGNFRVGGSEYVGYGGSGLFLQGGGRHEVLGRLTIGAAPEANGVYRLAGGELIVPEVSIGDGGVLELAGGLLRASAADPNLRTDVQNGGLLIVSAGDWVLGEILSPDPNCLRGTVYIETGASLTVTRIVQDCVVLGGTLSIGGPSDAAVPTANDAAPPSDTLPEPAPLAILAIGMLLISARRRPGRQRRQEPLFR